MARHTFFLNSGISVICANLLGHLISSLFNHIGPDDHMRFCKNACGNWLRDIASAGLSSDLTCRHSNLSIRIWISAMREATKVLSRCGDVLSQCSMTVELHQKIVLSGIMLNTSFTSWWSVANNNAPQSSSRDIVTVFNGATRDLAHNNLTIVFPRPYLERTYIHAP